MSETYKYGLKDLKGNPIPDSKLSPIGRDMFESSGDYDADIKKDVCAYYGKKRIPLSSIDSNKYIVKFIAGLWRVRKKPNQSYKVIDVYDKRLVLGKKIDINERDDFNFEYYTAAAEKYDIFDVLDLDFDMYVAKCNTVRGVMMRYGETRESARAFLRGAIMDAFAHNIASVVIGNPKQRNIASVVIGNPKQR